MSSKIESFGRVRGLANEDVKVILSSPGQKTALAIIASFEPPYVLSSGSLSGATFDEASFWAKLYVLSSAIDEPIDVSSEMDRYGPVLFEASLHSVGPHSFFYPLADLEGGVSSSLDGHFTIILTPGHTATGDRFIGILNVSGQIKL